MFLKIDVREEDLKIVKESLPLGDLIVVDELTQEELIVIERKSLTDLEASIKDGRYEEQSYRLQGSSLHNHNIIYLIEGDIIKVNPFKRNLNKMMIYSSIVSLNYFKGFSVLKTVSLEETAMMICSIVYKLNKEKDKKGFYSNIVKNANDNDKNDKVETTNLTIHEEVKDYCDVVKKVKKENINEDNIGQIMLSQIPGISSLTAKAILEPFKTLPNLVFSLKNNSECLNQICTVDSKGKSRKISKSVIAILQKYLTTAE
jgi:ERCC4-type nuclease